MSKATPLDTLSKLRSKLKSERDVEVQLGGKPYVIKLYAPNALKSKALQSELQSRKRDGNSNEPVTLLKSCLKIKDITDDDVWHLIVNTGGITSKLVATAAELCGVGDAYKEPVSYTHLTLPTNREV